MNDTEEREHAKRRAQRVEHSEHPTTCACDGTTNWCARCDAEIKRLTGYGAVGGVKRHCEAGIFISSRVARG